VKRDEFSCRAETLKSMIKADKCIAHSNQHRQKTQPRIIFSMLGTEYNILQTLDPGREDWSCPSNLLIFVYLCPDLA